MGFTSLNLSYFYQFSASSREMDSMLDHTLSTQWGLPLHAATETLANALRLHLDAKLLFENERYPSCASISVLAIEELAKFMALSGCQPLSQSEWNIHTAKQLKPSSFLMRKRYQAVLREIICERKMNTIDADVTYKRLTRSNFWPLDRSDDLELFIAAFERTVADGSFRRFSQAYSKQFERLKKQGLYVDIGSNMKVISSPAQITRDVAKDQLDFIRELLKILIEAFEQVPDTA